CAYPLSLHAALPIARLTVVGIVLAAVANAYLGTFREVGSSGVMALDGFRVFTNYVFLLAAGLFVLVAERYLEQERMKYGELYVLVLLAAVGMMVFAGSRDLMVIFIGLELMSVAVYVLTGANRRDPRAAEASLKYFLLGAFSSAFFLFGVALVYGSARSTNLAVVANVVGIDGLGASPMLLIGMV